MAWPISAFGAPNFDSGFVTLPNTLTNVPNSTAATCWLLGMHFNNKSGASVTVTVNDASGNAVVGPRTLAAGEVWDVPLEFLPATGILQWTASVASAVVGKVWGYI